MGRREQKPTRIVFRRAEASDDKLARLNVLRTDKDRQEFDEVANRYLAELVEHPKSAAEVRAQVDDLERCLTQLKSTLGVEDATDR
ncbi:hypothetical protein DMH04_04925 [Kibdelosporangium aridum]|uniref:Uncharacterized protein n=1 Tax=Kibdelosporangium aridum TaxID=2030 RepID=A0A428ZRW1_KIBAR|nr:hypothetical protein [Kibdelosporangium aridum]RSM90795.1 hypothetical protein DMH04_04925 [Kibdelosporangium aridum]